jgi:hypothetical protein
MPEGLQRELSKKPMAGMTWYASDLGHDTHPRLSFEVAEVNTSDSEPEIRQFDRVDHSCVGHLVEMVATEVHVIELWHLVADTQISDTLSLRNYLIPLSRKCEKIKSKTFAMGMRNQKNNKAGRVTRL